MGRGRDDPGGIQSGAGRRAPQSKDGLRRRLLRELADPVLETGIFGRYIPTQTDKGKGASWAARN